MWGSLFLFILLQCAVAVWAYFSEQYLYATIGLLASSLAWGAYHSIQGQRILLWLHRPRKTKPPSSTGYWLDLVESLQRDHRKIERMLKLSDARIDDFLAAIQASSNGVILLDESNAIVWANQTAASHLGLDLPRDKQQIISNLVRSPDFLAYLHSEDYSKEAVIASPRASAVYSGGYRTIQRLHIHIHSYGAGRKLLLSRDVTALEQAEAMRRDFVANVSHEIRTPLTVLLGSVETLQQIGPGSPDQGRVLDMMANQAKRMQNLVEDLLTLSRIEDSASPANHGWCEIQSLLKNSLQSAQNLSTLLWGEGQQRIVCHRLDEAGQWQVNGAFDELSSALNNIVHNAVRYTPAGGAIDIDWQPASVDEAPSTDAASTDLGSAGKYFVLSVRDNGLGIAQEHIPRLTERFYRVDQSRSRATGGTGLGLAIVKHVLQRHDAHLDIDSQVGKGSRFSIVLPMQRIRLRQNKSDDSNHGVQGRQEQVRTALAE